MRFVVTCRGEIDPAAIARLESEGIVVQPGGSVGGAVAPGGEVPDRPRRYHLRFEADDRGSAQRRAEGAVEAAGGFCSHFDVSQD